MADVETFVPPTREQRALAGLHHLINVEIRAGATEVSLAAVLMAIGETGSTRYPHLYHSRGHSEHSERGR
jgi:hypothetical protein